jgi:acyl-CoA synthetase (AMP-forming)/AMP-acid ligase II
VVSERVEDSSLWGLIEKRAALTPERIFAIDERGEQCSFGELRERALTLAAGLSALGIKHKSIVSWQLPTWIETMVLTGALARIGAVQLPLITSYRGREVSFILSQAHAAFYIAPRYWGGFDFSSMFAEFTTHEVSPIFVTAKSREFPTADPAILDDFVPPKDIDDIRWIYYTSGTTGSPKGARHSDATLLATTPTMYSMLELSTADRNSLVFPVAHIGGLVWLAASMSAGSTHLVAERFDPSLTIPFLAQNGVTLAGIGTPFNLAYLAAQRELAKTTPHARLFPNVRHFMSGASAKPPHLHATLREELGGTGIVSSYGMTEAPMLTAAGPWAPDEKRASTEGRAMNGVRIEIVNSDGSFLSSGEVGEIVVKAPQVCRGYVDASNNEAVDAKGWLHTGDLGYLDEEGFLTVTGRLKDIIIRNGENISAKEIEDLLFVHPKVADVAVIGLPHERTGEQVLAVVVVKPDCDDLGFEEMVSYLRGLGLMTQKIPERLEVLEALPRNGAGKVIKRDLQLRFANTENN